MALGDLVLLEAAQRGSRGARLYNVALGTPILAGEPVQIRAVGNVVVEPNLTSTPVVSTSAGVEGLFVGIAATNSTNTATAAGVVYVLPTDSSATFLISPTVPTSWDTQSEYDALVGKRVTLNNSVTVSTTAQNVGSYTVNATDSANNGVSIQALDIKKYPGKVAIAFRKGTSNLL